MPKTIQVELNGKKERFNAGIRVADIAEKAGAKGVLAAKVNGKVVDLTTTLTTDATVTFLEFKDPEGADVFRHSAAHLMAAAVTELYPESRLTIGPAVEDGFYYDIARDEPFNPDDLKKIEEKMKELSKKDEPFVREEIGKAAAKKLFAGNKYKLEMIKDLDDISIYRSGGFVDLCRGPHLPSTGLIKAFKLTKVAGAYWRGDASNDQLQRIYGIAFPDKESLKKYLSMIEEAKKRDHRRIGKDLDLFSFQDEGPGHPFWHPNGMVIYKEVLDYMRGLLDKRGYVEIKTPVVLNRVLWEKSGHWDHYAKNMYFTKIDGQDNAIKPMNCPGGVLVFKSRIRSYRELPLRVAEFGLVHRHELAGVLHGLFRVRSFTQDDAHIYCLPEQLSDEVKKAIKMVFEVYKTFGFKDVHVELSTRPEDYMGELKMWDKAEASLKKALEQLKIPYTLNEGDGAFYGPKIDFHISDCMKRTWQCGTIQVDFAMPETLDVTYMGEDGTQNHRPVMIHRAILGSIERFIGILIEHHAGKLPLWLSPVQARVITVADRFAPYAEEVMGKLKEKGIRADVDNRSETVSKKVREAQLKKVNYILVVGEKEVADKTVTVRTRDNVVEGAVGFEEFAERLVSEIAKKT